MACVPAKLAWSMFSGSCSKAALARCLSRCSYPMARRRWPSSAVRRKRGCSATSARRGEREPQADHRGRSPFTAVLPLVCGKARGPRPLPRDPGRPTLGAADARQGALRPTLRGLGLRASRWVAMGSTLPDGCLLERDADVAFVGGPGEHESLVHYSVRNNDQKSKPSRNKESRTCQSPRK